jgi:prepilin signal peptidase PulO-like enzyme (type II secretory pathway)
MTAFAFVSCWLVASCYRPKVCSSRIALAGFALLLGVALLVSWQGRLGACVSVGLGFALCSGWTDVLERSVYVPVVGVALALTIVALILDGGSSLASVSGLAVVGGSSLALFVASAGKGWGFGDVMLAGVLGATFGAHDGLVAFAIAIIVGFLVGSIAIAVRWIDRREPLPMATFFAVGSLACAFGIGRGVL